MDFTFYLIFSMFIIVPTQAENGTTIDSTSSPPIIVQARSRQRHHKAFFGEDKDGQPETKSIFPESQEASDLQPAVKTDQAGAEIETEERAIDAILAAATATRSGRQLDFDKINDDQLNEVISDPAIRNAMESGNEAEARGIIRDKLCALGLMSCGGGYSHHHHKKPIPHYGPTHHYRPRPIPVHHTPHFEPKPHYGQGIGHITGGTIQNGVSLVQPVAVQPVGGPISAVSLEPHGPIISKPFPYHPPPQAHIGSPGIGYVHPPPPLPVFKPRPVPAYGPPKPIYPSQQIYTEPIVQPILPLEKKVIEHVHHHVHHQGTPAIGGPPVLGKEGYGEYGVVSGPLAGGDGYYGAAQKQIVSVATPPGGNGIIGQPQTLSPNYLGVPNHARTCICVPIEQCVLDGQEKSGAELQVLGSQGSGVIQGTGIPHSGLIGYGIDPRNNHKGRSLDFGDIESNTTDSTTTEPSANITINDATTAETSSTRTRRDVESIARRNSTISKIPKVKGIAQPRRAGSDMGCRIRSLGSICCDPARIRNPLERRIPIGQLTSSNPIPTNSFNSPVLYNPSTIGLSGTFYGQCGTRNAQGGIHGRVVNGPENSQNGETDFGEYPWQVAILKKDGTFVCGGSLIDGYHVLTAAHAIKHLSASDIRVRLGEWDVNHNTEFYPHFERQVSRVTIHPEFYAGNLLNDVAILRFEGGIDFQQFPHVSPVCLAPSGTDVAGKHCFVTGWGKDAFGRGGKYQNVLKEVDLPVLNNYDCEQRLKRTKLGPDFVLNPGFLCAGGEAGKDACRGDGGGPLVCELQPGSWAQVGIVSWGVGCGVVGVPGVYVAVEHYQPWIQQQISKI